MLDEEPNTLEAEAVGGAWDTDPKPLDCPKPAF